MSDKKLCMGVIISPHGIKGEVKVKSFTSPFNNIATYPYFFDDLDQKISLKFRSFKEDIAIASIKGCNDRNMAETFKATKLNILRDELSAPDSNEFYYEDLIGLQVINQDTDQEVGQVLGVFNFGGGDLLEVSIAPKNSEYFLFNNENFPKLEMDNKKIYIKFPEQI
ncbi:ribosome maturation factor RimM [Rickettsiales endosymbiont of Stachyamoeba lipophora]|uniref:ribosome maturation factor RimM n=1 Tax=Rickettsiales endosymbiont of Stachyamoeba lipophora TaxID=2486578 RepID=UPI000F64E334|nr:ribosome maturation factor RimM [Rickettsiales endosymbiont of Stachyamoeba lipophora]AZL15970.1 16S rRNA processing protein RimM [Rickettsiales endosymbiont of Stachyamoeba lipophora]